MIGFGITGKKPTRIKEIEDVEISTLEAAHSNDVSERPVRIKWRQNSILEDVLRADSVSRCSNVVLRRKQHV